MTVKNQPTHTTHFYDMLKEFDYYSHLSSIEPSQLVIAKALVNHYFDLINRYDSDNHFVFSIYVNISYTAPVLLLQLSPMTFYIRPNKSIEMYSRVSNIKLDYDKLLSLCEFHHDSGPASHKINTDIIFHSYAATGKVIMHDGIGVILLECMRKILHDATA